MNYKYYVDVDGRERKYFISLDEALEYANIHSGTVYKIK